MEGPGRVGGGARAALPLSGIISHTSHTYQTDGADAPEVGLGQGGSNGEVLSSLYTSIPGL